MNILIKLTVLLLCGLLVACNDAAYVNSDKIVIVNLSYAGEIKEFEKKFTSLKDVGGEINGYSLWIAPNKQCFFEVNQTQHGPTVEDEYQVNPLKLELYYVVEGDCSYKSEAGGITSVTAKLTYPTDPSLTALALEHVGFKTK